MLSWCDSPEAARWATTLWQVASWLTLYEETQNNQETKKKIKVSPTFNLKSALQTGL